MEPTAEPVGPPGEQLQGPPWRGQGPRVSTPPRPVPAGLCPPHRPRPPAAGAGDRLPSQGHPGGAFLTPSRRCLLGPRAPLPQPSPPRQAGRHGGRGGAGPSEPGPPRPCPALLSLSSGERLCPQPPREAGTERWRLAQVTAGSAGGGLTPEAPVLLGGGPSGPALTTPGLVGTPPRPLDSEPSPPLQPPLMLPPPPRGRTGSVIAPPAPGPSPRTSPGSGTGLRLGCWEGSRHEPHCPGHVSPTCLFWAHTAPGTPSPPRGRPAPLTAPTPEGQPAELPPVRAPPLLSARRALLAQLRDSAQRFRKPWLHGPLAVGMGWVFM